MKYIKALIAFLLPILGKAVTRAVVDEVVKYAYGENKPAPREMVEYAKKDVAETEALFDNRNTGHFHDVILVAFDLDGPNAGAVHEWLHNQMPGGDMTYPGREGDIHLDSWWVADDERFDGSDCDSAIFVPKGRQGEAREFLGRNFPADPQPTEF